MTQDEAFARITARGIADLGIQVARGEIRTSTLTERLALVEEDIERIQKVIGHITCAPNLAAEGNWTFEWTR